jgi:hypothetical protein
MVIAIAIGKRAARESELERERERERETRTNNDTDVEINRKIRPIFRVGPGILINGTYLLSLIKFLTCQSPDYAIKIKTGFRHKI